MILTEPQPARPEPNRRRVQFSLQTLLLLFVVLASSLAVFGAGGLVVFALTVGLAICLHRVESFWSLTPLALVVLCLMCLLTCLALPAVQTAREAARRANCCNELKQIGLALLNYHDVNGCFPPAYIADKNGKPMHSWRVLILPHLEEAALYKAYDFTEPWDGPKNRKLLGACPPLYQCPSDPIAHAPGSTQTSYVAVVGRNAAWPGAKSRKIGPDFATSNTIMVVEVANSGIQWSEPRDLSLDAFGAAGTKSPALTLSSNHGLPEQFFFTYDHGCGANVAMADDSMHYLPPGSLSTEHLRKILQVGGYKEEASGSGNDSYDEGRRLNWPNIAALAVWLLSVGALLTRAVRSRKARPAPAAASNTT